MLDCQQRDWVQIPAGAETCEISTQLSPPSKITVHYSWEDQAVRVEDWSRMPRPRKKTSITLNTMTA